MKIELKYDGKDYYDPIFKFLWNAEKDDFVMAIKFNSSKSYDFIIKDILENFEKCKVANNSFYYYTKENVYVFNLSDDFSLVPKNRKFEHCVVLLDENDKIIEYKYPVFEAVLNENNNS